MYNAWAIPLRAAFPYQTKENVKYWLICDYMCDAIYIVDILLFKMRISFLNSGLKEVSVHPFRYSLVHFFKNKVRHVHSFVNCLFVYLVVLYPVVLYIHFRTDLIHQ